MARSKTSMCNTALNAIGDKQRITEIDDDQSEAANVCRLLFDEVLDQVITEPGVDWNCARARAQLAQNTTDPAFGWDHQYTLPADYLRLRKHTAGDSTSIYYLYTISSDYASYAYTIEGRNVLANTDTCYVLYIKQVTDVTILSPTLAKAVCTLLASNLATRLAGNKVKAQELLTVYENVALPKAIAANQATEYIEEEQGSDDWAETGRY